MRRLHPMSLIPGALACAAAAIAVPAVAAAQAADSLPGAKVWQQRCSTCHNLDGNKIGPPHRGVYGRKAGTAPGYAYSAAIKASGLTWSGENLDRWLQGPQKLVPGAKMFFTLADPAQRAQVIAYLKAQSGK